MNKFIDWIISNLKYIGEKSKLLIMQFYNKTSSLINVNVNLNKIYKPIISEKIDTNKKLQSTLKELDHKNKQAQNIILKQENQNVQLQSKISIIQDLLTKRHD